MDAQVRSAQNFEMPPGIEHIATLSKINSTNRQRSEEFLHKRKKDLQVLGSSLSALYAAATCSRKGLGGNHLF